MKIYFKFKILTIFLLCIGSFFMMGTNAYADSDGSVGVTGTFSTYEYKIVQGETIDTPMVNVVFVNHFDYEIKMRLKQNTPDGVNIHLTDEIITIAPNGRADIPIVISADENAIPGEYKIHVTAKLIEELVEGKINIGSEYSLSTTMTVFGEAADFEIDVVDVAGNPIEAVMNLYQVIDGKKTPMAYTATGKMYERVIPGDYEVFAFWNGFQLAQHSFSLVSEQVYKKELVAETVQIYAFSAQPVFVENTTNELATASLNFVLHNIYKELDNSRVELLVYKNDELVETKDIFKYEKLEVNKHRLGLHYVPAQGWDQAEYKFVLKFYVDEHNENDEILNSTLYATSLPVVLDVSSGFSFKAISDFFNGKLIMYVIIAALLAGIFFAIKFLIGTKPAATPKNVPKTVPTIIPSKKCPDCGGEGVIECPVCNGTGETMYGSIKEECIYCSGIGQVVCATCINPRHLIICPRCTGQGSVTRDGVTSECTYCNGLGSVLDRNYAKYTNGVKMKLGKKDKE